MNETLWRRGGANTTGCFDSMCLCNCRQWNFLIYVWDVRWKNRSVMTLLTTMYSITSRSARQQTRVKGQQSSYSMAEARQVVTTLAMLHIMSSISNHTNQKNLPLSRAPSATTPIRQIFHSAWSSSHIKNFVTISNITSPLVCQSNIGREQPCRQTMIPCSLTKRQKDMLMYNIATLVSCWVKCKWETPAGAG